MVDMSFIAFKPALPEIFLACSGMALLMLGVFRSDRSAALVSWLSVFALIATAWLAITGEHGPAFGGLFVATAFSVFAKVLVLVAAAVGIILSIGFNAKAGIERFEYPVLIVFSTVGMMMMISANDLIALYLGLELQSLGLYVLASFARDDTRSTEAGLKYFVLGALSSGMLLYGSSLVYGFSGTTNFLALNDTLRSDGLSIGIVFGLVFISAGLAFKTSAVPFHMWTPDVYEGAPTPVTAFFSVGPKIAAIALFVSVLHGPFGNIVPEWQQIIVAVAVGSMLVGSLAAITQRNIKRLMAYSSIGHVGFAFVGLAAGTSDGAQSVLTYMAIYLAMNLGTFAIIIAMRRGGKSVEQIDDLAGLSRTHPGLAVALAAFMFSMAGIPPLAGFFAKLYVFRAAVEAGLTAFAVIGVVLSVISCFYYLRIVKIMYFDEPKEALDGAVERNLNVVAYVSAVMVLLFIVKPELILDYAGTAAAALFAG